MTEKPLTVRDLIRALSKLPPNMLVMSIDDYQQKPHNLRGVVTRTRAEPDYPFLVLWNGNTNAMDPHYGTLTDGTPLDFAPDAEPDSDGQPFDTVYVNGVRIGNHSQAELNNLRAMMGPASTPRYHFPIHPGMSKEEYQELQAMYESEVLPILKKLNIVTSEVSKGGDYLNNIEARFEALKQRMIDDIATKITNELNGMTERKD
jgi:hypothetical protein